MPAAMIEQLNRRGIEVLWAASIAAPGVWVASHALLILSMTAEGSALRDCCTDLLTFLGTDPHPSLSLDG